MADEKANQHNFEPGGRWCCRWFTGSAWCELPLESPFHTDSPFSRAHGGHTVKAVVAYDAWKAERVAEFVASQPELIVPRKGKLAHCSICCAEIGEEHDVWCNGTGIVAMPEPQFSTAGDTR